MDKTIDQYKDKKVLILGLGLNQGGVGSARFFAEAGALVKVADLKSAEILKDSLDQLKNYPNIEYVLGEHKYEDIDWADIIIRNPALKPQNEYRIYAEKSGKPVETDMGIFLEFVNPKNVIGVTGTKGKSTTSSLINELLLANKKEVVFAGNIGKSILDTVAHLSNDTFVVLELSSFQLEAWKEHKVSPHIAVITNIFPDHLDYYGTMDAYIAAKKIIGLNQSSADYLLLSEENEILTDPTFTEGLQGKVVRFSSADLPKDFSPTIKGEHNLPNCAAALQVSRILELDDQTSIQAMESFKGVPFRQQIIKVWNGITIINDTAATTPDAAIQAIKTFPESVLIAGGMNKGLEYDGYAEAIDEYARSVYFIDGTGTDELLKLMKAQDKIKGTWDNFEEILKQVQNDIMREGVKEGVIIFSPGGTSFNHFQNEFDRGRKFNAAVEKIFD